MVLWSSLPPAWADPPRARQAGLPDPGISPSRQSGPAPAGVATSPPAPLPAGAATLAVEPVLPEADPSSETGPVEPATSLPGRVAEQFNALGKTADHTHELLERGILLQVLRLDDFFGKVNSEKELHTSYLLRWRNSLRLQQGGGVNLGTTLRANVDLSRISERLQLSFSGEDKPDPLAPSLPEDPGSPGFDRTFRSARVVNSELRYQLMRTADSDFFLGAGVDFVLPPEVFARARYQRYQRLSETFLARFGETLFAKTPDGVGETTELSIEHSLNAKSVLRWANSATLSQEIGGLEWGSELSLLHELSPRSAVTLTGGVYGDTGSGDHVSNYRVQLRYRRNFLRSWLYYELEPLVAWPRNSDGRFPVTYAATFRLEVVFQGEEKPVPGKP